MTCLWHRAIPFSKDSLAQARAERVKIEGSFTNFNGTRVIDNFDQPLSMSGGLCEGYLTECPHDRPCRIRVSRASGLKDVC